MKISKRILASTGIAFLLAASGSTFAVAEVADTRDCSSCAYQPAGPPCMYYYICPDGITGPWFMC